MPQTIDSALKKNATASSDLQFNHGEQNYFVKSFESTGYLSLKSERPNGSTLFSLSAFVDIGHRHADDFSFVLQDSSKWIFIDPGKYTYDRTKDIRSSIFGSIIVSLLIMNLTPQTHHLSMSLAERITAMMKVEIISIQKTRKVWKTGVEHHRKLIYAPGEFFVVVDNAKITF